MSDRTRLPSLGRRGEGWVFIQIVLLAVVFAVGVIGNGWALSPPFPRLVAATLLGAAGAVLLGTAIRALGREITPMPRPGDRAELKQTGPYARVRHPIYGGLMLIAVAWSLFTSPWALIASGALVAFLALKALLEEYWLIERYPEYPDYARRVRRRFVPYLW